MRDSGTSSPKFKDWLDETWHIKKKLSRKYGNLTADKQLKKMREEVENKLGKLNSKSPKKLKSAA